MKETDIVFATYKVDTLDFSTECTAARVWTNDANEPVGLTLTVAAGKIFVPWSRVTAIHEPNP